MIAQLFLICISFQFMSAAEPATCQALVNLQCKCAYVSNSNQDTNTGSSSTTNTGSSSKPNSCNEVTSKSQSRVVVTLASGLEVVCDTETNGGGWLVIQRRINGIEDFYRGWEDYKKGFGDKVNGDFYLGNENIYRITTSGTYELRIDLEYQNKPYWAQYSRFSLLNENEGYKLQVSGYSGNAGDSFSEHNGMKFSTFDKENDISPYLNCAKSFRGGWWYKSCHTVSLNGVWGNKDVSRGINWFTLTGYNTTISRTEMKIRKI